MQASSSSRQHVARTRRCAGAKCTRTRPLLAGPAAYRTAGPSEPAPDYAAIDAAPLNRLIMALFRRKMVDALGKDSQLQG